MSPEQAVGRPVDRRSDIFSFGAVLYEMLTGKRAFAGASTPDVLEAVVKSDPDWLALPAGTPEYVRNLLGRCLAKDRKQRLQAIGEARIALENPKREDPPLTAAPSPSRLSWAAAAAFAIALAALAFVHFREQPPVAELTRFQIPLPTSQTFSSPLAPQVVSPDGRMLAFAAAGTDGKRHLWIRPFDSLDARQLPGIELGSSESFFWSADSRFLAFHVVPGAGME